MTVQEQEAFSQLRQVSSAGCWELHPQGSQAMPWMLQVRREVWEGRECSLPRPSSLELWLRLLLTLYQLVTPSQ